MKNLGFLALVLLSMIGLNCSAPQENSDVKLVSDKQLALKVDGMVCAVGCAKFIEKQVSKMDGVTACTVNFEDGTASVSFSSQAIGEEKIIEAITDINDGQYKVTVVGITSEVKKATSSPQGKNKKEKSETEVSFYFPELVTYFMSRIIR